MICKHLLTCAVLNNGTSPYWRGGDIRAGRSRSETSVPELEFAHCRQRDVSWDRSAGGSISSSSNQAARHPARQPDSQPGGSSIRENHRCLWLMLAEKSIGTKNHSEKEDFRVRNGCCRVKVSFTSSLFIILFICVFIYLFSSEFPASGGWAHSCDCSAAGVACYWGHISHSLRGSSNGRNADRSRQKLNALGTGCCCLKENCSLACRRNIRCGLGRGLLGW